MLERTFAASMILFNLCSVSAGITGWVEPVNVAHWAGKTVQNSTKFILSDSSAPKSRPQISRWICLACARRELEPPPHFADPLTCGPKNIASIGPGDVVPRQFNVPLLFHGLPLFGALQNKRKNNGFSSGSQQGNSISSAKGKFDGNLFDLFPLTFPKTDNIVFHRLVKWFIIHHPKPFAMKFIDCLRFFTSLRAHKKLEMISKNTRGKHGRHRQVVDFAIEKNQRLRHFATKNREAFERWVNSQLN